MFQFACRIGSVGYIFNRQQQTFLKILLIQLLVSCHSFNIVPAIFGSFDGAQIFFPQTIAFAYLVDI
jgi:hypothetical protein